MKDASATVNSAPYNARSPFSVQMKSKASFTLRVTISASKQTTTTEPMYPATCNMREAPMNTMRLVRHCDGYQ